MTQMITNYLSCLVTLKQISVPAEETVRRFDPTFCDASVAPILTIVSVVLLAVGMLSSSITRSLRRLMCGRRSGFLCRERSFSSLAQCSGSSTPEWMSLPRSPDVSSTRRSTAAAEKRRRLQSQVCDELAGIDVERLSEHEDVDQTDVPLTALHRPDVGPVQARLLGQPLLR